MTPPYEVRPVGYVESSLVDREDTKAGFEGAPDAWLVFDPGVVEAIRDLAVGAEVFVLTWLHRARRDVLAVHPRDDPRNPETGCSAPGPRTAPTRSGSTASRSPRSTGSACSCTTSRPSTGHHRRRQAGPHRWQVRISGPGRPGPGRERRWRRRWRRRRPSGPGPRGPGCRDRRSGRGSRGRWGRCRRRSPPVLVALGLAGAGEQPAHRDAGGRERGVVGPPPSAVSPTARPWPRSWSASTRSITSEPAGTPSASPS